MQESVGQNCLLIHTPVDSPCLPHTEFSVSLQKNRETLGRIFRIKINQPAGSFYSWFSLETWRKGRSSAHCDWSNYMLGFCLSLQPCCVLLFTSKHDDAEQNSLLFFSRVNVFLFFFTQTWGITACVSDASCSAQGLSSDTARCFRSENTHTNTHWSINTTTTAVLGDFFLHLLM